MRYGFTDLNHTHKAIHWVAPQSIPKEEEIQHNANNRKMTSFLGW